MSPAAQSVDAASAARWERSWQIFVNSGVEAIERSDDHNDPGLDGVRFGSPPLAPWSIEQPFHDREEPDGIH